MYVFDPAKHADMGKVREREAEEGQREGRQSADQLVDGQHPSS